MSGAYRKGVKLTDKREKEGEKATDREPLDEGRSEAGVKSESSVEKERESREKRKGNANEGRTNEENDGRRREKRRTEGGERDGGGAERRERMRRGDDNGVGWLIREGCVSRGGTKGRKRRDEAEGQSGAGANQPPINPTNSRWTCALGLALAFPPRPRVFSIPPPSGGFVHTY